MLAVNMSNSLARSEVCISTYFWVWVKTHLDMVLYSGLNMRNFPWVSEFMTVK